ncbi:SUMF1/EgtB/PvdO family nonheme iron enzyme, partial [Candidatus Poribacteria bacterium]|nr:SUMF1/EgtB/PvdO family nonheme iron enzyme [Candidatus Poribacteria bacterium]
MRRIRSLLVQAFVAWLVIVAPVVPAAQVGETYALLIGINDYRYFNRSLAGPENDVAYMRELLMDEDDGLAVPGDNIRTILSSDATKDAIQSAIVDYQATRRRPEDLLIVYFSGHGTALDDDDGGLPCLLPYGAKPGGPATFISLHRDLAPWMRKVTCRTVVILDACYTADRGRGVAPEGDSAKAYLDLGLTAERTLEEAVDVVVYAAGLNEKGRPQPAYEFEVAGKTYGAFTYFFGEAVRGQREGRVTAQEAASRASMRLRARPEDARQTPTVGPPDAPAVVLVDRGLRVVRITVERPTDRHVDVLLDNEKVGSAFAGAPVRVPNVTASYHTLVLREAGAAEDARVYDPLTEGFNAKETSDITRQLALRTVRVTGWVVDARDNPLEGAAVYLIPEAPLPPGATTKGVAVGDGSFTIAAPPGTYTSVGALLAGYEAEGEERHDSPLEAFQLSPHEPISGIRITLRMSPTNVRFPNPLPPDAIVYVDGMRIQAVGQMVTVSAGATHVVSLKRPGFRANNRFEAPSLRAGDIWDAPKPIWRPLPASLLVTVTDGATGEPVHATISGDLSGSAGSAIEAPSGRALYIQVTHKDYHAVDMSPVTADPGEAVERSVELVRRTGSLWLRSNVEDVTISIDGEPLGAIGRAQTFYTAPVGSRRLVAEKDGYVVDNWLISPVGRGSNTSTQFISLSHTRPRRALVRMIPIPVRLIVSTSRDDISERRDLVVDGVVVGPTPHTTDKVAVGLRHIAVRVYEGDQVVVSLGRDVDVSAGDNAVHFDLPSPQPGMFVAPAVAVDLYGGGVTLNIADFHIDQYEVTVGDFAEFLAYVGTNGNAGIHHVDQPSMHDYKPHDWNDQTNVPGESVRGVSWYAAYAYARWRGRRLPTEAEWVYAMGCGAPTVIATGDGARKRSEDVREWLGDAFRADYIHGAHDGGAVDVGDQRV